MLELVVSVSFEIVVAVQDWIVDELELFVLFCDHLMRLIVDPRGSCLPLRLTRY